MNNIILIGFMGSEKTPVGRALSQLLECSFIDMDEEIAKREGKLIQEIIKEHGEDYFRELESNYLKEISNESAKVISTGGGVILKKENVDLIKEMGIVVFLHMDQEQLVKNLKNSISDETLIKDDHLEEKTAKLLDESEKIYLNTANIIIQTTNKSIDHIAQEIKSFL